MKDATMNIILHLGLGSFHRAHQAVYLQRLIEQGDESCRLHDLFRWVQSARCQ